MDSQRREALDELILSMRAGRLRRRTFMERALRLGLTAITASSLLEACGTMQCLIAAALVFATFECTRACGASSIFSVGAKQVLSTCFAPTEKMLDAPQARVLRVQVRRRYRWALNTS
jgi:hypothetical protein